MENSPNNNGLREKWRRISFEQKIALFVAPIVVAVVGAVAQAILNDDGDDDDKGEPVLRPGPYLTVDAVGVANEPPSTGGSVDRIPPPSLDLKLRNLGKQVSVITGARFRIRHAAHADPDGCFFGGAELPTTGRYDVRLPVEGGEGRLIEVDLNQQLPPNSADRFQFRFWLDDPEAVLISEDGTGASRFFQLEVGLLHDGKPKPLPVGATVMAVPFPWYPLFVPVPPGGGVTPSDIARHEVCMERNVKVLGSSLDRRGARSDELARFARDPTSLVCSGSDADTSPYCRSE